MSTTNHLPYSSIGKVREFKVEKDHISIGLDYDDFGSQYGSFPINDILKELFPVGSRVKALFDSPDPWSGRMIKGLVNNDRQGFIIDPVWEKELSDKRQKEYEEYRKKERERMLAIPRYRYESKYQFPEDVDIWGGDIAEEGEGFRNSSHLSVSRGMEFLEDKDPKDFVQLEYEHVKGITKDNKNMDRLKDHINECVIKELGNEWGHSGASMGCAVSHVLKAKELGWDNYIDWIRKGDNKK